MIDSKFSQLNACKANLSFKKQVDESCDYD